MSARNAASLWLEMSLTALAMIARSTCRQYQTLVLRRWYRSRRSPMTASLFGPHPRCFRSHAANRGGCLPLMLHLAEFSEDPSRDESTSAAFHGRLSVLCP